METTCAFAKMEIVQGVITPTTGMIATVPASKIDIHVTKLVFLDTISARYIKTLAMAFSMTVKNA